MNDTTIEKLLRKAPPVKVPGGLLEKLRAGIVLPRPELNRIERNDWRPMLKRWIPALSFGALFLGCLVAIAVQSNVLSELRKENKQIETSLGDIEQLRRENAEYQRLFAESQQLEQLRKDNQELERLRVEVAQLREQTQELAQLRAENQRLLAQQNLAPGTLAGGDPFAAEKKRAQSTQCVSNLKQIGLGLRMWAHDHTKDWSLPPDFLTAQDQLNSPKILVCPSDTARTQRFPVWTGFGPGDATYEYLTPGASERKSPTVVITRCPIHGHVGLAGGHVHADSWKRATQKDGRWVLEK